MPAIPPPCRILGGMSFESLQPFIASHRLCLSDFFSCKIQIVKTTSLTHQKSSINTSWAHILYTLRTQRFCSSLLSELNLNLIRKCCQIQQESWNRSADGYFGAPKLNKDVSSFKKMTTKRISLVKQLYVYVPYADTISWGLTVFCVCFWENLVVVSSFDSWKKEVLAQDSCLNLTVGLKRVSLQ